MNSITRRELRALMDAERPPCVSIFMPIHRTSAKAQEDPIRLKNLLGAAAQLLSADGTAAKEGEALLEPGRALETKREFWVDNDADGLALYLCEGFSRHYRLPQGFKEGAVVGRHFSITPLVNSLLYDGRFYVLALTKDTVRLFEGTRSGLSAVDLPASVPQGIAEALPEKDLQKSLQHHGAPGSARQRTTTIYHGQGVPKDVGEKLLNRYLRAVASALRRVIEGERVPVVLAAVDYVASKFRDAYTDPYLLADGIQGSPDAMEPKALHEQSLAIVEPWFQGSFEKARYRFGDLLEGSKALEDSAAILLGAYEGKVETVFAAKDARLWGRFDPERREVELHQERRADDIELVNRAVELTLERGGEAYVVEQERMPGAGEGPLAAVLRW